MAIAVEVREKYNFTAPVDYTEIAFELLHFRPAPFLSSEASALLIVGSGMLGRALASHARTSDYGKVYAVSRASHYLANTCARPSIRRAQNQR